MGEVGRSGYEIGAVLTCHSPSLAMNYPVRAEDNFAVDLLLLLVLALVAVLLREVDAVRGGLSGKENTGDVPLLVFCLTEI